MFGMVPFKFGGKLAKGRDPWDRLMESVFDQPLIPLHKVSAALSPFKVDVKDTKDAYEVTADLPGFAKEEISVVYDEKYLTIAAVHEEEHETKDGEKYICRERHSGKVERSFYIDDVDEDNIKAEFKEGILKIALKKALAAEVADPVRKIDIE